MGQEIRIEESKRLCHITTRTVASELWFINNRRLEHEILTYLARNASKYGVIIYGFALMGNHYHLLATFPECNRAEFMRSFNSIVARLVSWHVQEYERGRLWGKRYAEQKVMDDAAALSKLTYLALQPMNAGLARRHKEFDQYNSFADAMSGAERSFPYYDLEAYKKARRKNPKAKPEQFRLVYKLKYAKLPQFEHLSQQQYREQLRRVFEEERLKVVREREESGKGFVPRHKLREAKAGSKPKSTKKGSYSVVVHAGNAENLALGLSQYFEVRYRYRVASEIYRKDPSAAVRFPPGTYPPPICACAGAG